MASTPKPTPPQTSTDDTTPVPLLDISRENKPLWDEIDRAIAEVCRSGQFVLGPAVRRLEEAVAAYCGTSRAVGCASGSDALLLALMACDVGPGDEVILPSFTFFATASAVWRLGARPVFVDIEPDTFNLDASQLDLLVTEKTKAILPVHLFGQCADMDAVDAVARVYDLSVIEDAAQAIGAEYAGRRTGSLGDIGCFSFYPTKNFGGFGDGGMLTTDDETLADRLVALRNHGMQPRYYHPEIGVNSRLDSIQAAVLGVKLPHLDAWTQRRAANARRYRELFAAAVPDGAIVLPEAVPGRRHVWNQFTIRIPGGRRDALREHLAAAKIGTEIYYPVPLHAQACFAALGYGLGSLPETERAASEVLSLPIFPGLTAQEQETVVARIAAFLAGKSTPAGHELKGPQFLRQPARPARKHT